ncbi:hypothetical protein DKX38_016125 [Salix brachista]|uniref:peroxidase n=1 Tax=Salix brachista TaxID=2182728 RepID=A0A5N5L7L2_9ROSI|nr:hypothetical protein DKX38_016125 [Salix brachista]
MKRWFFTFLLLAQFELYMVSAMLPQNPVKDLVGASSILSPQDFLSFSYYHKTCPAAEEIINQKMTAWFRKDYTLAASIIRLHFHDCAIRGRENVTALIDFFQERGLNVLDLVVLSGSHTIGRSSCRSFLHRLANYKGTGRPDPTLDRNYLRNLTRSCKWSSDVVYLDTTTPKTFDMEYYNNLGKKMGLLSTDQELYSDPRTQPFVSAFTSQQPDLFFNQFAASMVNLGNILFHTAPNESEIRLNCNYVNPAPRKTANPPRRS